jgi:4-amino-4-deoxy-L-arabinose transferase-like glycosyltransferase
MTTTTALAIDRMPNDRRHPIARVFLGERTAPVWARPALWGLLIVTAVLYLWNLADSGYANTFYAAAVEAGSKSWKALFFGSLDSSNFITVDKPPASLWVMGISARIFGFSSWSVLAPQALMGVASVALVYGTVRRSLVTLGARASTIGGLLGGAVLAFTPAAALMFRFDNPDALLVLLMTAAAYFVVRALPKASWRWLALAGVALGFAFLTKMLQGLLVLPAFGLVYLIAANTTFWKRMLHLLIAAGALVVSAGWFVVVVALWPAAARPYIGGSTNNTVLDLVFGYNGFGRILGGSGNGGGGGTGTSGSSFGGATGLQRLFSSEMGLEISWLLPAALLALVLGLIATWRRPRTDLLRAGFVMLGGWLLVTGVVFSFMSGTIHPYYTVALAPAIGGLVALGGVTMWKLRDRWLGRIGLAAMFVLAGMWAVVLLNENTDWMPWLRWVILIGTLVSAALFLVGSTMDVRRLTAIAVIAGTLFGLGGTAAYSIATASVAHSGSIPSVGSTSSSQSFGGGGAGGGGTGGGTPPSGTGGTTGGGGTPPSGTGGTGGAAPGDTTSTSSSSSSSSASSASSASLDTLLAASTARWAATVNGSQSAATLELSSGTAVMAIGGWSSDPTPTLAQFKAWVKAGDVGYYVVSGQGGGGGGGNSSSSATAIETWVKANFTATTVGSSTVYALTK